jgi:superkiller protein 3
LKDLNKEQILFIGVLVILGALAYFRLGDSYSAVKRVPRSKPLSELELLPPCPEIQFVNEDTTFFSRSGRNIFAPPRDWLPLEPLILDAPPQLAMLPVAPFPSPGLGEAFFAAYRYEPSARTELPSDETLADAEMAMEEAPEEGEAGNTLSITLEDLEETDPEAELLANYDWIRLKGQTSRIFGTILNENRYALAANKEPISFQQVARRTGSTLGKHEYDRERIEDFGFADTVVNRIELAIQEINFNAGNLDTIHQKARWCLTMAEEEPAAATYAAQLVQRAVELDPHSKESYTLLSDIYESTLDTERQLEILRKAMESRLNAPGVYVRYGNILRRYGMDDAAQEAYLEAERIEPRYAEALVARAGVAYDAGHFEESLHLYEEAFRSPSWMSRLKMQVLLGEGKNLLALNRLDEATIRMQRAIQEDEESGDAWNLKGAIALVKGDLDGAEAAFTTATSLAPDRYRYRYNRAVVAFRKGDLEDAIGLFEEAIDLDPFHSCRPLAAQGFMHECLGDDEAASAAYEQAVQVDPEDFYALYLWGRALRRQGDLEASIDTLKRALQLNGKMVDILGELGHACLRTGLFDDAAFYFEEYLKRTEGDFRVLYLNGLALLGQNRLQEAVTSFDRAMLLAERNPDPYNGLGYARYGMGDVPGSLDSFSQVLRLFEEGSRDPRYLYAVKWSQRIDEHHRKSQWIDEFQRKEIKNEWKKEDRCGPAITLINNQVVLRGVQRQEQTDERTALKREHPGKVFRVFEADLVTGEDNQARWGIFLGYYISRGLQGSLAKGEVILAVEPGGNLVYHVVDQSKERVIWERLDFEKIPPGEPVNLGIEVINHDEGRLRLSVDGEPVLSEDLVVKSFKKISRHLSLGVFGQAPGGRNLNLAVDRVRVVISN